MARPGRLRRNATPLLRHGIFLAAFLTYLYDRVDVVWRLALTSSHPRVFERLAFVSAAVFLGLAATRLRPSARAQIRSGSLVQPVPEDRIASLLFDLGIAALVPVTGAALLLAGELLRVVLTPRALQVKSSRRVFVFLSAFTAMVIFSLTLSDRVADVVFGLTFLAALWADFSPIRTVPGR